MSVLYSNSNPFLLPVQKNPNLWADSVHQLSFKSSVFSHPDSQDAQDSSSSSSSSSNPLKESMDYFKRDSYYSNKLFKDAISRTSSSSDLAAILAATDPYAAEPPLPFAADGSSSTNVGQDLSSIIDEAWLNDNTVSGDDEMVQDGPELKPSPYSPPSTPPHAIPMASPTRSTPSSSTLSATITPSEIFPPVDAFPDPAYQYDYFLGPPYDPSEFDPSLMFPGVDPSILTAPPAEILEPFVPSSASTGPAPHIQAQLQALYKEGLLYDFSARDRDLVNDPFAALKEGGLGEVGDYAKLLTESADAEMEDEVETVKFEDDEVDPLSLIHQPSPNNPGRHAGNQPKEPTEDLEKELQRSNLSARERRQLRNKISARNFRLRKKEYVSTLEDQLRNSESDRRALRSSLTKVLEENRKLKAEVAVYRKAMGSGSSLLPELPTADPVETVRAKSKAAVEALNVPPVPTQLTANQAVLPADPAVDLWASLGLALSSPASQVPPVQNAAFGFPAPFPGAYQQPSPMAFGVPTSGDVLSAPYHFSAPTTYPQDFKAYLEMLAGGSSGASAKGKSPASVVQAAKQVQQQQMQAVVTKEIQVGAQAYRARNASLPTVEPPRVSVAAKPVPEVARPPAATQNQPQKPPASLVFTTPASLLDSLAPAGSLGPAPQAALSREEYDAIKRNIAAALRENSRQRQVQQQAPKHVVPAAKPPTLGESSKVGVQNEASQAAAAFIQSLLKGTYKWKIEHVVF
ncbi:hypothetical protein M427DRAFT_312869 [Gonapodya prolifera JEL478]|uniref:BZIP domain-containing protein n=1 Tax=Gonapodya prolifera (strain JEL478) TaxID=1344416 RepID=A0A139AWP8_GONPJ|nr:hypothetical protein M427DRAFT_312869 [Gonapodya prolifera JEL478]|eukprot:KXS21171.1 hypothetical protein M427DRAFT_312869 [Gonapodya prolifera JEL478]